MVYLLMFAAGMILGALRLRQLPAAAGQDRVSVYLTVRLEQSDRPYGGGFMKELRVFYNDNDPFVVQWLRNLVDAGLLPAGYIDSRSIVDVAPNDLEGYVHCHFFAGIGGWAYAFQLAGWPSWLPAWTGSCPCQPFSVAGRRMGYADERHLWPVWRDLIDQRRPPVVFGEQVASKAGCQWLAVVQTDLEEMGYQFAAANLCAAGVGAPHIRQRLWFAACRPLADADRQRLAEWQGQSEDCRAQQPAPQRGGRDHWQAAVLLPCRDGQYRPAEPGICPLADGVPARVGRLRAYGNAIVPQVAAAFVETVLEALVSGIV